MSSVQQNARVTGAEPISEFDAVVGAGFGGFVAYFAGSIQDQPDHRGPRRPLDPKTSARGAPRTALKDPTRRRNPWHDCPAR